MLDFHTGLTEKHTYQANPWSWLVMGRPTSFFYETPDSCGASSCSQEILALGTPFLWWLGTIAVIIVFGLWARSLVKRRQENSDRITRRRVDQLHRTTEGVSHTNLADVLTSKTHTEVKVNQDHWVPLAERELTGVTLLPKGTAQSRAEWQPNEIPVPTYVNAPKAVQPKRIIDLTEPGKWSEEQQRIEREALAAAAPSRDEVFDQQLADEAVQRLRDMRAANE